MARLRNLKLGPKPTFLTPKVHSELVGTLLCRPIENGAKTRSKMYPAQQTRVPTPNYPGGALSGTHCDGNEKTYRLIDSGSVVAPILTCALISLMFLPQGYFISKAVVIVPAFEP